jgi:hypothetical protein
MIKSYNKWWFNMISEHMYWVQNLSPSIHSISIKYSTCWISYSVEILSSSKLNQAGLFLSSAFLKLEIYYFAPVKQCSVGIRS